MDIKWIILGIALVMYLLVIIFQEKKVWMTSVAALAVIVLGFLTQGGALAGGAYCHHNQGDQQRQGEKRDDQYRDVLFHGFLKNIH